MSAVWHTGVEPGDVIEEYESCGPVRDTAALRSPLPAWWPRRLSLTLVTTVSGVELVYFPWQRVPLANR